MAPCDLVGDQAYQRLGRNTAFIVSVGYGGNQLFISADAHLLDYTVSEPPAPKYILHMSPNSGVIKRCNQIRSFFSTIIISYIKHFIQFSS